MEFPCGSVGWRSGVGIAAARVTMARVQTLAHKLPHASGMAKKEKKKGMRESFGGD